MSWFSILSHSSPNAIINLFVLSFHFLLRHFLTCILNLASTMRIFLIAYLILYFKKYIFLKNNIYIYIFIKLIFFNVFKLFWCTDIKNKFFKIKIIILMYLKKNTLKNNYYYNTKQATKQPSKKIKGPPRTFNKQVYHLHYSNL